MRYVETVCKLVSACIDTPPPVSLASVWLINWCDMRGWELHTHNTMYFTHLCLLTWSDHLVWQHCPRYMKVLLLVDLAFLIIQLTLWFYNLTKRSLEQDAIERSASWSWSLFSNISRAAAAHQLHQLIYKHISASTASEFHQLQHLSSINRLATSAHH